MKEEKNFSVDKTKSMVKLIIFVLSFVVNNEFPNSNVWVKKESLYLWSILVKLFRSVQRLLLYKGRWRTKWITDSTSLLQLHIGLTGSCELCLNSCSCKCLRPRWFFVIYLISIASWQIEIELEEYRMNFGIFFLKRLKLSYFRRPQSYLFHWVIVNGK